MIIIKVQVFTQSMEMGAKMYLGTLKAQMVSGGILKVKSLTHFFKMLSTQMLRSMQLRRLERGLR